jgi:carboxyl-terminal processing protease
MRLAVPVLALLLSNSPIHQLTNPPIPLAAETFDAVWTIVRDTHFDPAMQGVDWDAVRAELRPRALSARTPGELRAVLGEMLSRLHLSHFAVIPASPDDEEDTGDLSGEPGFDVRLIDGELVVSSVEPQGGAARAGVRPGWLIDRIGTTPASAILKTIAEATSERIARLEAWRAATAKLRGPEGSTIEVAFRDGGDARVVRTIGRQRDPGEPVTVGALPTLRVRFSADGAETPQGRRVGVIRFSAWMTTVDAEFQRAIDRYRDADGIVIDLRGNPGGLAAMLMGISGQFLDERTTLGVLKTRDSELRFVSNPRLTDARGMRVQPFAGPVAILVDGLTGSASECFAGGMQAIGRARVFGQTSMGQALPALFDRLPNGDVFIHAWGDFVTADGTRLEGRGVVPDDIVPVTRENLLAGRDAPLEAALAWFDTRKPRQ